MLYFLSGKYRNGLMDGSDGWMDGHTFSPTTLIQKHLPSGAQCAKSWWNLHSENSHLWDFPLLKIPPGSNLRISTLGFSHIESDLLVIGGALKNKKDIYSGNQHCGKSYGENSTNNLHSPNIKSHRTN